MNAVALSLPVTPPMSAQIASAQTGSVQAVSFVELFNMSVITAEGQNDFAPEAVRSTDNSPHVPVTPKSEIASLPSTLPPVPIMPLILAAAAPAGVPTVSAAKPVMEMATTPAELDDKTVTQLIAPTAGPQVDTETVKDAEQDQPCELPSSKIEPQPVPVAPSVLSVQPQAPEAVAAPVAIATAVRQSRRKPADNVALTVAAETPQLRANERIKTVSAATSQRDFKTLMPEGLASLLPANNQEISGNAEMRLNITTMPGPASVSLSSGSSVAELRQLSVAQDLEWIGALTRDIVQTAGRENRLQFRLIPENLGQLDIALSTDMGQVDIRLETSTAAAAQIISAEQTRLIEDLRQSGLKLGQFEMSNRQNGNGQHQQPPTPDAKNTKNIPIQTRPSASSKAAGRFA